MDNRPTLYVDTSAWNAIKHVGGTELLSSLFRSWCPVYSDGVLRELYADRDHEMLFSILGYMSTVRAVRVIDKGYGSEQRFRLDETDVRLVRIQPRVENAVERLVMKFYGGRSDDSFADIVQVFGNEITAVVTATMPPHLVKTALKPMMARLPQIVRELEVSWKRGINFNGREVFRATFALNPVRTNANNIRPPQVIDQLWSEVQHRVQEHFHGRIDKEQFFGTDGHDGLPHEFLMGAFEKCIAMYSTLNFYGYAADDRLTHDHRIASSLRDGRHVALATSCAGLLTADEAMHKKAFASYEFLKPGTKSLWLKKDQIGCRIIEGW